MRISELGSSVTILVQTIDLDTRPTVIPFSFVPVLGTYYIVPNIGTMKKTLHSPEYQKLTEWLKLQREAKGMSMRELGEKLEISHSFIGKVEQRERKLDVIEYIAYCKALGVSPLDGLSQISTNH